MRRIAATALLFSAACANLGAPPGGPLRTTPPALLSVSPESGTVNVRPRAVVFTFDEVLNDRDFEKLFMLSPQDGRTRVSWHRDRIEVRPRRGFRENTTYTVTMLPGITDLRNNALRSGRTIVFSTGSTIPPYFVLGRAFDWSNERVAAKAVVQAIRRPDSLPYVAVADSAGQFGVGPLNGATYTVLGFLDNNNNRAIDRGEIWDSVNVTVAGGTSPFIELLLAQRDTIPPRLQQVTATDSLTINVSFDRPLDPDVPLTPERFTLVAADSTPLRIADVRTRAQMDSLQRARPDSTRRDTTARTDSAARTARRDTTLVRRGGAVVAPVARPSRPAPPKDLTVKLDPQTPMRAGRFYRITASGFRGLLGGARTTDRVFSAPRPRADTTSARKP